MGRAQPNPAQEDDVGTHRQEFLKDLPAGSSAIKHVYPERYQKAYGYWRPVIRASIDKFLKPVVSLSNHVAT